jgi:hypothetical protein
MTQVFLVVPCGPPPLAGVLIGLCANKQGLQRQHAGGTTSSKGAQKVACRKIGLRTLRDVSGSGSVVGSAPGYLPPRARCQ